MRRLGLVIVLVALCAAVPAFAAEQPVLRLLTPGDSASEPEYGGIVRVTPDGRLAAITTDESMLAGDTDEDVDVYRRDVASGELELLSGSPDGGLASRAHGIAAESGDVLFQSEANLLAEDSHAGIDLYVARADGTLELVTPGADQGAIHTARIAPGGEAIAFATREAWSSEDSDAVMDAYRWTSEDGLVLVSDDDDAYDAETPVSEKVQLSADGSTVGFDTDESLSGADDNTGVDAYVSRDGGSPELVRTSAPEDATRSRLAALSADGTKVLVSTDDQDDQSDTDGAYDLYRYADGVVGGELVSFQAAGRPDFACAADDLSEVVYDDIQEMTLRSTAVWTFHTGSWEKLAEQAHVGACSSDARHVLVHTTANLVPEDTDEGQPGYDAYLVGRESEPRLVNEPATASEGPDITSLIHMTASIAADGSSVFYVQYAPEETVSHRWDAATGLRTEALLPGQPSTQLLEDARGALYLSADALLGEDTDGTRDHYLLRFEEPPSPPPPPDDDDGGGGDPPAVTDTTAPALSGLAVTPGRPRARKRASVQFTSSEAGAYALAIERRVAGRRKGGRCVKPSTARAGKRCKRYVPAGSRTGAMAAGENTLVIRLRKPGRHRLTLVGVDAAGNASAPARLTVKVRRKKR